MRHLSFLIFAGFAFMPCAAQAEVTVNSVVELRLAIKQSKVGSEITIAPGMYDVTDLKLPHDITLLGQNEVIFYSSRPVAKGLINPLPGASIRIENIRFFGAHSPDQNGAGIRHDGANLTVIDCIFENNENGILSTGSDDGQISIQNSKFLRNGYGDGYSHGIYVVRATRLNVHNSQFIGTRIGHHIKSLARNTNIQKSIFDDADGRTSYAVDVSKGGAVSICSNQFIQASNADNSTIINYDLSRGGKAERLTIVNNRISNHHPHGKLLRNKTSIAPVLVDNKISNLGAGTLD